MGGGGGKREVGRGGEAEMGIGDGKGAGRPEVNASPENVTAAIRVFFFRAKMP